MKRVLVVTYYWPPSGGSGVQRWVKFAKYLPQEGWQPVIYTPENPEYTAIDHTLEAEVPHTVEIIRRPITEPYNLYRKLMGKGASTDMKTLTAGASGGAVTRRRRHGNLQRQEVLQAAPLAVDPRQPVRAGPARGLGEAERPFPQEVSGGTSCRCDRYDRSAPFDAPHRPAAA